MKLLIIGLRPTSVERYYRRIIAYVSVATIDHLRANAYVNAMSELEIITLPDPMLRQASMPVECVDDALRKLMHDMLETMYAAPGIGLAAVQVAIPRRVIVVDIGDDCPEDDSGADCVDAASQAKSTRNPICMVNPEILKLGGENRSYEEGCLSLPDVLVEIERPTWLQVQYIDRDGMQQQIEADGLLATVIQHEIDHLDGRLIIDFLSRMQRDIVVRKLKKLSRSNS